MTFELLGPLSAHVEGKTAQLGGRRPRSVLAVLALRAGEVVSVDTLIEHLWGDEPPGDPVNSLQVHVSALRRVLEPGRKGGSEPQLLRNRPPGYLLDVDDDAVDVVRFEALARRGEAHLRSGEASEAVAVLSEALALWRGPLLADLADERFVAPEAARLGELRLSVTDAKHDAELALGRHREILPQLEQLVEEYPLREQIGRSSSSRSTAQAGRPTPYVPTSGYARFCSTNWESTRAPSYARSNRQSSSTTRS